jgi:hypothetical protein
MKLEMKNQLAFAFHTKHLCENDEGSYFLTIIKSIAISNEQCNYTFWRMGFYSLTQIA